MGENFPRRNIRLLIAYDGTDFCGWQKQTGRHDSWARADIRTVQGDIENALGKIHGKPVPLSGSGRTDSGVHAAGQVANFYTSLDMEAARFVPALNGLLSRDLRILESREIQPDFHARFDTKSRTYRYYLIPGRAAFPWDLRYAWQIRHHPDVARLNGLASLLRGETDCSVFATPGDKSLSRNRYISGASFFMEGNRLIFEITANAFLWKMARSILGTLLHYEERNIRPSQFREILASKDRSLAGPTAPAHGLFLWKIDYYRN